MSDRKVIDANEAVAHVAHRLSEVIAIYPITPASPMGEHADEWTARGRANLWGAVPEVIEMQSEAGAAAALHGAVLRGALATTFTASQGLLLMVPEMFKIAGELTPTVIHVAARSVATHALSIFGDHSDVMAARSTGFAMLCSPNVVEAADMAAIAHAATLATRVPFLHFFDGFRTSHELNTVVLPTDEQLRDLIDHDLIRAHRGRGLDPDRPVLRGSAQNPDVFFQAREACTPFHAAVPAVVQATMDRYARLTGRQYHLVQYHGAPDAERVVVLMGSGSGAVREAVDALNAAGERVGMVVVRLYRPFPTAALLGALPPSTRTVVVLDRTKEPGAPFEPLHLDVLAALWNGGEFAERPRVIGGRYGLSSKEFTPAMARAAFAEAAGESPRNPFTVGIVDDVSHTSLPVDASFVTDNAQVRAVFYGLGADGTVGANKNTAKIIGANTDKYVQAYFVYDSKKSGSMTVSHVRVDSAPIDSSYLIGSATFVGVHQWNFLSRVDVLSVAAPGATVLVNAPFTADQVWDQLTAEVQQQVIDKALRLFAIDAGAVARDAGLGGRINTVMQTCFFGLAGVVEVDEAMRELKDAIADSYGARGEVVVERNVAAVDRALANLHEVPVPTTVTSVARRRPVVSGDAPDFVQRVTARMLAGEGDLLPVSALPPDGAFPTGTARYEKRTIASEIPIWEPDLCIDCGKCAIVCPHAAIRLKVYAPEHAVAGLKTKSFRSREVPGMQLTVQVAPDDCTGCGVCVQSCPAHDKSQVKRKSINMTPIGEHLERERDAWEQFLAVVAADPAQWDPASVKTSQLREPLFEFSGACAGCGETPYLKLLTQLFGDHLLVANATGCSSIYGGNLPTTPYTVDASGRGPAWANSLFEDNAEFGLGIRLGIEAQRRAALALVGELRPALVAVLGEEAVDALTDGVDAGGDAAIRAQRARVTALRTALAGMRGGQTGEKAAQLAELADTLVRKSVWIVGGDGWAYDIGAGGLNHVLGSGRDVNILVLDTEVYSNTGGQASKATPRGAVAKFAAGGKAGLKKDLGLEAMSFGDVYVARVAMGASDVQTVKALLEADAWPGVSLVIAYSTCTAHGFDMKYSMSQQKLAVQTGHWPLYRYRPAAAAESLPFQLDSADPSLPYSQFAESEARFAMLARANPERAAELAALAQKDVDERWRHYRQLADVRRASPGHAHDAVLADDEDEP